MPVALISTSTSPSRGPSRSTVSMVSGWPDFQATAAGDLAAQLRVAGVPALRRVVAAREVDQDGLCIAQHEAVVVDHRQLAQRVDVRQEGGGLVCAARKEIDRHGVVRNAEPRQHLPHLEAVARQRVVVQLHRHATACACFTPKRMPRSRSQRR
jgi:hypothetical protein